jgi:hypothetical protein
MNELSPDLERLAGQLAAAWRPSRRDHRRALAFGGLGVVLATVLTLALTVDLGGDTHPRIAQVAPARAAATIPLAKLPVATRHALRRKHILGPALKLLGTPFPGLDLYRGPSTYGTCLVEVNDGHVGGTDCGDALDDAAPGIVSSAFQPITVQQSTTNGNGGAPVFPPSGPLKLRYLYGAATAVVRTARLLDRDGTTTSILPLRSDVPGYVVFGSTSPDPDGEWVELLDAAGSVVQRIQVSE